MQLLIHILAHIAYETLNINTHIYDLLMNVFLIYVLNFPLSTYHTKLYYLCYTYYIYV